MPTTNALQLTAGIIAIFVERNEIAPASDPHPPWRWPDGPSRSGQADRWRG